MSTTAELIRHARAALAWARCWFLRSLRAPVAVEPCRVPVPVPLPLRVPRPRVLAKLLVTVLAAGLAPAAALAGQSAAGSSANGQLVQVRVLVEGRSAPLYFAPGRWDRYYFQAFRGRNYALEVRNTSGRRVGVLIAVDGLNVVNGERNSLSPGEAMYVLDPYETAVIRGWRTSLDEVRRFVFVDEERSYAERTGQANGDMGWIRVLAFNESRPVQWWNENRPELRGDRRGDERKPGDRPGAGEMAPLPRAEAQKQGAAAPQTQGEAVPAPGAEGAIRDRRVAEKAMPDAMLRSETRESSPGTGWGERRVDPVQTTWFVAERHATDHLVLRYEYESGLRALGIYIGRDRLWERERGELGFARPPQW